MNCYVETLKNFNANLKFKTFANLIINLYKMTVISLYAA